jgi:hypothetical protein
LRPEWEQVEIDKNVLGLKKATEKKRDADAIAERGLTMHSMILEVASCEARLIELARNLAQSEVHAAERAMRL